jgi:hypothetical protein
MSSKSSDAKIKANRKYTEKTYKKVSTYFTINDMIAINEYCSKFNYSKNGLIVQAVKEKIERDTGKSFDEFLKENQPEQEQHQEQDQKDADND